MKQQFGLVLLGIGMLHQFVGLLIYGPALPAIFDAGIVNAILPPYWDRNATFWYYIVGFLLIHCGLMTHWLLPRQHKLPPFWGAGLLLLSIGSLILIPASGFWFLLVVSFMMLRQPGKVTA